jgi:hypothetical protein
MGDAPVKSVSGNTEWATRMARVVKDVVIRAADHAPRSQQVHLGPSELGVECDRQVVGKLVREPRTNHVTDPWPSVVGTAVHAWLADAFEADNQKTDQQRWFAERRVAPWPGAEGTGDLYDAHEQSVDDHKVLGETSLNKVRAGRVPRKYRRQLFLYGLGFIRLGLPVKRVAIFAYPRTGSTLDGLYVWEAPFDAAAFAELSDTFAETQRRKAQAAEVLAGRLPLHLVPRTPTSDECYFCPFYRPQAGRDDGPGCPGTVS